MLVAVSKMGRSKSKRSSKLLPEFRATGQAIKVRQDDNCDNGD